MENAQHTKIGSPRFLAPEVAEGRKYSFRADIWGVGLCYYEILTRDVLDNKKGPYHSRIPEMHKTLQSFPETFTIVNEPRSKFIKDENASNTKQEQKLFADVDCLYLMLQKDDANRITGKDLFRIFFSK